MDAFLSGLTDDNVVLDGLTDEEYMFAADEGMTASLCTCPNYYELV